ncbi:hypothetical protein H8B09_23565 [Paenibacillus sp. PR3]|uniref:Uncharacterized protein n=1 Tax=Paenibacillus terricola TaxID=2763503 RepID=A0ABR8N0P4_9BACL|nr:LamG-like jellyroll fold domain-containing protein [Paenibacillus terricola]MBD3921761.1 hypothetical protein [Paenibacillus terricola]
MTQRTSGIFRGKKLMSVLLSVSVVAGSISAGAGSMVYASNESAIPTNGLIADYSFAEAPQDGKTIANNSADAEAVGDAVVQNESTAMWTDNALVFSGAGTSVSNPMGTWVSLPNDILSGKTSATVSIEVKPSAAIITKNHFMWSIGNTETANYWFANTLAPRTSFKYGGTEKTASSVTPLTANRWYNITSVIDADTNSIKYYVDGVKVGEATDSSMSLAQLTDQSRNTIGRAPYNDPMFEGAVSTFRVYDRALDANEVKTISDADSNLHADVFEQRLQEAIAKVSDLVIGYSPADLPSYNDTVTWTSNTPLVTIAANGITATAIQPMEGSEPAIGTLTATMSIRGITLSKDITVKVLPVLPEVPTATNVPQDGLIANYSFIDAPLDGRTIVNTAPRETGVDYIGNAIVQNPSTAKWEDQSLVFSGEGSSVSSPTGTWVSLPNDLLSGKTSATVSIEVKPSAAMISKYHFLWSIGNTGTNTYWFANARDPRTTIKYSGTEKTAASAMSLSGNRWYSLTSVIDADAKKISFYVDGVKTGENQDSDLSLAQLADQSRNTIGRAPFNDPLFEGAVSTFRVYDRALNADEIKVISDEDAKLRAPQDLKADAIHADPDHPSVSLSWTGAKNASKYNVYRQSVGSSKFVLLGSSTTTEYADEQVELGFSYRYQVSAVDAASAESRAAGPITVTVADSNAAIPDAPLHLRTGKVNKNDLSIAWDVSANALIYYVYRADKANGTFEIIGKTSDASYTDTAVLTTIPYYYKVAAVNEGGISAQTETLATPAVTVLYRQAEFLDRALVAVKTDAGIYVGWKMLGNDPSDIAFNLYRDGEKVNAEPITGATNLLDADGIETSVYELKTVAADGTEAMAGKEASVWNRNYLSVPLQKPADDLLPNGEQFSYYATDTSVGDLDGDGTYELIVKWDGHPYDNSQFGYTGKAYIDAYKLDGTRMWRIDLGVNIRAGAHYTQFLVYDFDGDGKSEVAFKTADGTVDGTGVVIGDPNADYRNEAGFILEGNEYLTVFEGVTGKAVSTVNYDPPRGNVAAWGDAYGNRVDRFLAAVAYLDGEHPSLVFSRGYYTRTVIASYDFKEGGLVKRWVFDTNNEDIGKAYEGQGNHNLSVGDVDGDGKDEITFGAMAIDDDGTPLYNTRLGHGDAMHLGDLDPSRPGLEVLDVHENNAVPYGLEFRDAETGETIFGVKTGIDTGRGLSADVDPNYLGEEVWASTIVDGSNKSVTGLYSARGELITTNAPSSTNFAIWWDGDLSRELLNHVASNGTGTIDKWDPITETTVNLVTAQGTQSNNGTKGNPGLQADLFGDWREEAIWRSVDSTELRIYTTTDLTDTRLRTLMHDPIYRLGVAWQNVAYNQPPHTSFYLGTGMEEPPAPLLNIVGGPVAEEDTTAPLLSGLADQQLKESDVLAIEVTATDSESDIESLVITFDGWPVKNGQEMPLTGLRGDYTLTATAVNKAGLSTTHSVTIHVYGDDELYASISGNPASVVGGSEFTTNYKIHNVNESILAQDIIVTYDSAAIEFLGAESLVEGFQLISTDAAPGRIHIIAISEGETNAIDADTTLFKMNWKAKVLDESVSTVIAITNRTATGEGVEKSVAAASTGVVIQSTADKTALISLLASAQEQFDLGIVGTKPGQYSQQSKDRFGAAIAQASVVAEDELATAAQVEKAVEELTAAIHAFAATVIVAQPGDTNEDGEYSIGDLGIVAAAYGLTSADPQWGAKYSKYDLDHDNVIDLDDLVIVALGILNTP